MLKLLIMAALWAVVQNPGTNQESRIENPITKTGIITGTIKLPNETTLTQPLQVVLLSSQYVDLWNSDLQKRLDIYWERYKPAFARRKEFFTDVSRMANRDAILYVISRVRRDLRNRAGDFMKDSANGRFEFREVPLGDYKVVAVGRVGQQEFIWSESVEVTNSIPQFIELKKLIP